MTNPETAGLLISEQLLGVAHVVAAAGEIDVLTAPTLQQALESALRDRPAVLIVDLSEVTFLASAGLGVLAGVSQLVEAGTSLKVVANGRITARPIELTGLNEVLAIYATRDAAIADI